MKRFYLFTLSIIAAIAPGAVTAHAQDTCKIFTIENVHGAAMDITKIWVVDTVNFTVESMRPLPFFLGATDSFDIKVCIRARDGQRHSTIVRYSTTHGTVPYTVSMDAPGTSSVAAPSIRGRGAVVVEPNPAAGSTALLVKGLTAREATVSLVGIDGAVARTIAAGSIADGRILLDLTGLASGLYLAVVKADGDFIAAERLVVR